MSPRLSKRRLFGIDRSGPPPAATMSTQPLNPWTIPNLIGYLRLAGIPVFLVSPCPAPTARTRWPRSCSR